MRFCFRVIIEVTVEVVAEVEVSYCFSGEKAGLFPCLEIITAALLGAVEFLVVVGGTDSF